MSNFFLEDDLAVDAGSGSINSPLDPSLQHHVAPPPIGALPPAGQQQATGGEGEQSEEGEKRRAKKRARVVLSLRPILSLHLVSPPKLTLLSLFLQVVPCAACVKRGDSSGCVVEGLEESAAYVLPSYSPFSSFTNTLLPPTTRSKQPFALNEELAAVRERVAVLEGLVASLLAGGAPDPSHSNANSSSIAALDNYFGANGPGTTQAAHAGGLQVESAMDGRGMKAKNGASGSEEESVAAVLQMLGDN
ncbi:hypothetical protein P7C70_g8894, partial [Phenoliferia sp. Uapishka_3]